jgi:hypothetical protein
MVQKAIVYTQPDCERKGRNKSKIIFHDINLRSEGAEKADDGK